MRVLRSACGTVRRGAPEEALGLDRSAAQATDSEDTVHRMTDTSVAEAGIRRHQRKVARQLKGSNRRRTGHRLSKLHRQRIRIRDNDTHPASRKRTDIAKTTAVLRATGASPPGR